MQQRAKTVPGRRRKNARLKCIARSAHAERITRENRSYNNCLCRFEKPEHQQADHYVTLLPSIETQNNKKKKKLLVGCEGPLRPDDPLCWFSGRETSGTERSKERNSVM